MKKYFLPLVLALTFLLVEILTISDYGINWDSPLHMLRGQAYAHLFLTGKDSYGLPEGVSPNLVAPPGYKVSRYYFASSELWDDGPRGIAGLPDRPLPQQTDRKIFYQSEVWNGRYFKENDWTGHLALTAILGAMVNQVLWGGWGLVGDLESYQLVYLLISSLGVFIVSLFAWEITGSYVASLVAGLSLGLFPIFFAESHLNLKDPAQAVFFTGAVWGFWHWVKGDKLGPTSSPLRQGFAGRARLRRVKWFGVFIMFVALALAVKWNIVFLPVILLPWLILIRFKEWGKLGKLGIVGGLGVIIFLILIWPYAWGRPQALLNLVKYYLDVGTGFTLIQPAGFVLPFGFNLYPLALFLTQTPEIILILGGIGVIGVIRRREGDKTKTGYLLLLWLLIPLIRLTLPGARSYAGIRQIMEIMPAMAVLAGVGAGYLITKVQSLKLKVKNLEFLFCLFTFAFLLIPIIRLHPNQNAYFNILAGGLTGAKEKNLIDWTLSYGNVYKQGALWINKNARVNSNIAHLAGPDFALSPLYLREDISISPDHFSSFEQKGEYILSLYNPLDPPVFAQRYPLKFLNPIHRIAVDGVSLLSIYKNDPQYLKTDSVKEGILKAVQMIPQTTQEADFWKIDLGKDYQVTRLVINGVEPSCIEADNEVIAFIPFPLALQPVDFTKAYVLNEKKDLGEGRVEYLFAKESARFIYIYPQNDQSCFTQEKVLSVIYLNN